MHDGPIRGAADDRDRVGELGVVVPRALDQEALALEPLEHDLARDHDRGQLGVGRFGRPAADQRVEVVIPLSVPHDYLRFVGGKCIFPLILADDEMRGRPR